MFKKMNIPQVLSPDVSEDRHESYDSKIALIGEQDDLLVSYFI